MLCHSFVVLLNLAVALSGHAHSGLHLHLVRDRRYVDRCSVIGERKEMIIKTKESLAAGAVFIASPTIESRDDCLSQCCRMQSCNTAVVKHKGDALGCYLFDCGSPAVCLFSPHTGYSAISLTPTDSHAEDLAKLALTAATHTPGFSTPSVVRGLYSECESGRDCISGHHLECLGGYCVCQQGFHPISSLCRADCSRFQFECTNAADPSLSECIAVYDRCNGIAQCMDGSDELQCPLPQQPTPDGGTPNRPYASHRSDHSETKPPETKSLPGNASLGSLKQYAEDRERMRTVDEETKKKVPSGLSLRERWQLGKDTEANGKEESHGSEQTGGSDKKSNSPNGLKNGNDAKTEASRQQTLAQINPDYSEPTKEDGRQVLRHNFVHNNQDRKEDLAGNNHDSRQEKVSLREGGYQDENTSQRTDSQDSYRSEDRQTSRQDISNGRSGLRKQMVDRGHDLEQNNKQISGHDIPGDDNLKTYGRQNFRDDLVDGNQGLNEHHAGSDSSEVLDQARKVVQQDGRHVSGENQVSSRQSYPKDTNTGSHDDRQYANADTRQSVNDGSSDLENRRQDSENDRQRSTQNGKPRSDIKNKLILSGMVDTNPGNDGGKPIAGLSDDELGVEKTPVSPSEQDNWQEDDLSLRARLLPSGNKILKPSKPVKNLETNSRQGGNSPGLSTTWRDGKVHRQDGQNLEDQSTEFDSHSHEFNDQRQTAQKSRNGARENSHVVETPSGREPGTSGGRYVEEPSSIEEQDYISKIRDPLSHSKQSASIPRSEKMGDSYPPPDTTLVELPDGYSHRDRMSSSDTSVEYPYRDTDRSQSVHRASVDGTPARKSDSGYLPRDRTSGEKYRNSVEDTVGLNDRYHASRDRIEQDPDNLDRYASRERLPPDSSIIDKSRLSAGYPVRNKQIELLKDSRYNAGYDSDGRYGENRYGDDTSIGHWHSGRYDPVVLDNRANIADESAPLYDTDQSRYYANSRGDTDSNGDGRELYGNVVYAPADYYYNDGRRDQNAVGQKDYDFYNPDDAGLPKTSSLRSQQRGMSSGKNASLLGGRLHSTAGSMGRRMQSGVADNYHDQLAKPTTTSTSTVPTTTSATTITTTPTSTSVTSATTTVATVSQTPTILGVPSTPHSSPKLVARHPTHHPISAAIRALTPEDRSEMFWSTPGVRGAVVALSLGISLTVVLLMYAACRYRRLRKISKRRRPPVGSAGPGNDADYLVNGMYL